MQVCLLHVVDSPLQFGGVEKVFLALLRAFSSEKNIKVSALLNKGLLFDSISACGINAYILPDKGMLSVPSFYSALLKMTTDFNPDIIHSHHRYTTFLAQFLPFRRYELIHTFHVEQFTKGWNNFFGDHATAVSKSCKEHFVRQFNLQEKFIEVIHNGVSIDLNNDVRGPAFRQNIKDDDIIVSVIGRLTEQKGHSVLIKAVSILPANVKKCLKVILVGGGEKQGELEDIAEKAGLKDCIIFAGYQERVYPYIRASSFTILPSLWEGFGLAIVESFLFGKPAIGSSVGGIPEVIVDRENGLLVPPDDFKALADAMLHLIRHPELVKKYGEAGREHALNKFSEQKMVQSYKRFYRDVLEGKGCESKYHT